MNVYILIGVLLLVFYWVFSTYNFFVTAKTRLKAAVQEIGNQLKRQADLIPNLEASVKGYLKHEKDIFDKLTSARKSLNSALKSGNMQAISDAGNQLTSLIPNLQVIVESNPELKSSDVVAKLMEELRDTADKMMYARRLVIDLTNDYNVKRVNFPSNLVANAFNFQELPGLITPNEGEHLSVSPEEMKPPKVKL